MAKSIYKYSNTQIEFIIIHEETLDRIQKQYARPQLSNEGKDIIDKARDVFSYSANILDIHIIRNLFRISKYLKQY